MMKMQRDFDLNSLQTHTEPLKDAHVMKQTMLKQEITFRNQVHEVHQLYNMQKSLIKEAFCEGFDRCNPSPLPLKSPTRYENGSIQCLSQKLLEGRQTTFKNSLQRHFDLQLPADEFINHVDKDLLVQHNTWDCSQNPGEELKLSLSVGVDERPRGSTRNTLSADRNNSHFPNVIDLEESDGHGKCTSSPEYSECCQERSSSTKGKGDFCDNIPCDVTPTKVKQFSSYQMRNWDLNQIHPDTMDLCGEDLFSCSDDHKNANIDLNREASCEKSEIVGAVISSTEQSHHTFQDGNGTKSPVWCKSYCASDNGSSNGKTECSGITVDATTPVSKARVEHHIADTYLIEGDLKTPDHGKEDSAMADVSIQVAAGSLIHLSSGTCKDIKAKSMKEQKQQLPRCPADSFELMTLKLTESNMDDDCVSSKPVQINDVENKGFSSKLRRGRRWKDFQKEVLPAIASLSGHEIREDICIIDGVLRSREYRKMQAKMVKAHQVQKLPAVFSRSRRSRLNYVKRRNFSFKFN